MVADGPTTRKLRREVFEGCESTPTAHHSTVQFIGLANSRHPCAHATAATIKLANIRENGAHSLSISCKLYMALMNVDASGHALPIPALGPHLVRDLKI
jgi:hypothetical protein